MPPKPSARGVPVPQGVLGSPQLNGIVKFDSAKPGQPSCQSCPAFKTARECASMIGRSIGAPVCLAKTKPVAKPGMDPSTAARSASAIAKSCEKFNKPLGDMAEGVQFMPIAFGPVGFPVTFYEDEDAAEGSGTETFESSRHKVKSCLACAYYVDSSSVRRRFGWDAGLCLATGHLLLEDRLDVYPVDCSSRIYARSFLVASAEVRQALDGFTLLEEYKNTFGTVDPLAVFKNTVQNAQPLEWPSDKPVGPKARSRNIRAFRKIEDPSGHGEDVYLPVYDIASAYPDLADLIPRTGDQEHPEWYVDHGGSVYKVAVLWTRLDETPALWGPPGTGKTELFRHFAWRMGLPFHRLQITASLELDELAGRMKFYPDRGTVFEDGRLPRAWKLPGVICIDEANAGQPEVWQFIRPLTDNSKTLMLDMNNGERIPRHSDCFLGMAMNPGWDPRNTGLNVMGDADARRLVHLWMDYPPHAIEEEIIRQRCAADGFDVQKYLRKIMQVSDDIRKQSGPDGGLPVTWGVANNIKAARCIRWFSPLEAYDLAIGNYLEPSVAEIIRESVRTIFD